VPLGLGPPPRGSGRGGGEGVRTRDHLANVRTFLASARAGIALAGLGYVVDKLDLVEARLTGHAALPAHPEGRVVGLLIVALGGLLCAAGFGRLLVARAMIDRDVFRPRPRLDLPLVILAAAAGLAILGYLIHVGG
jgi:putative membrane protein